MLVDLMKWAGVALAWVRPWSSALADCWAQVQGLQVFKYLIQRPDNPIVPGPGGQQFQLTSLDR